MKKLKRASRAAHRRALLQSTLDQGLNSPSATALGSMMRGYQPQGDKPSTGTRPPPRDPRARQNASGMNGLDHVLDRMIAAALTSGPHTTGVLGSLFGLSRHLSGR
jgi:hypothetical protein